MKAAPQSCDIFCAVVDNYGDIGVCWRLARQLAHEHGMQVRLWVDDLASFAKLCPEADPAQAVQQCRGVQVWHWAGHFPKVQPAALVIGAFDCKLPENYVQVMADSAASPVWINLEYLSAEDWVETHHQLPSPHPRLALTRYFFFPGFTSNTGGLLLEHDLLARRAAFCADQTQQHAYWRSLGVTPERAAGELRISLFSYENPAVADLLQTWAEGETPIVCCVPEGRVLPQVAALFGQQAGVPGAVWQRGQLRVHVLPFVEQEQYDPLLWACDINFVRGEDSCVRAQWAAKPFVWHIYPQHDGVHMQKLQALAGRYGQGLAPVAAQANAVLWQAWNGEGDIAAAWQAFAAQRTPLEAHAGVWAQGLAQNNLALNLLDFFNEVGRIRAFEI